MRQLYILHALVALFILISITSSGQDLIDSRTSSYYTFIYKITNDQASSLYNDIWNFEASWLHEPYDMFPTDSLYKKKLPVGHYAFIRSNGGNLTVQLRSIDNLEVKLLNNHRDMMMVFSDSAGKEIRGLPVRIKNKKISYDKKTNTYRLKKSNRQGVISVLYDGHESFFEIGRQRNNPAVWRATKKVLNSFPTNHLISPIIYLKNSILSIVRGGRPSPPGIHYRTKRLFEFKPRTGFIAFNKPMYKPGDTVRLKAAVTSKKGKPFNKEVDVYLAKGYRVQDYKKLTTLKPFRDGAYKFDFKLVDSLKLDMDRSYEVKLRTRKGKELLSSSFRYEEYELKQNTYSVRSEGREGKPAVLFVKGVDSNDMPLYDVRIEVLLRPSDVRRYFEQKVFIPDTLWYHETKLDPTGETKIIIPDSLMPSVRMGYEAVVSFLNSENERVQKTASLSYNDRPFPVSIEAKNDSIVVTVMDSSKLSGPVKFSEFVGDHSKTKWITLPYQKKLNVYAEWYTVTYQDESDVLDLEETPDKLALMATRTVDSLFITTENPRKVPFRYFLFKNQKLIERSETASLTLKRRANTQDVYTLSIQYIWASQTQDREYNIPFDAKNLRITIEHPSVVYPGQKANFTIDVHDAKGKPVKNVDLTAYAITKKFDVTRSPSVPNLARPKQKRYIINEFHSEESDLDVQKSLDFAYWKKSLGLDSITYYKFLFPDSGYFESRTPAAISQFAPFAVGGGGIADVQVIYVDGQPVYYKEVGTLQPYSFAIKPGLHTINLRLRTELITINKIKIDSAQKLIFSINRYSLPKNCSTVEMPSKFTEEELTKLSRYFVNINSVGQNGNAYIQQGDRYHVFEKQEYSYRNQVIAGPFYPGTATYFNKGGFNIPFSYESHSNYTFSEGLLKLRYTDMKKQMQGYFGWNLKSHSFKDEVITLNKIQEYWKSLERIKTYSFKRFPDYSPVSKRVGKLILSLPDEKGVKPTVKALFILNVDRPDEYYVLPGVSGNPTFNEGRYQAIIILDEEDYLRVDSVVIRPFGTNFYDLRNYKRHERDTFTIHVMKLIQEWAANGNYITSERHQEMQKVRELYYRENSANYFFNHAASGRVTDESGDVIPGVNVLVKGTSVGTVTDAEGYYSLQCPSNGTLVFSFVGYQTTEHQLRSMLNADVTLNADVAQLSEVVVVGYGVQSRRSYLSSATTSVLSGRVAGVQVSGYNSIADSVRIYIRGNNSIGPGEPMVILDGVVVRLSDVDPNLITAMQVLKDPQRTAIYGARAANGVMLISTKPGVGKEYLKQMSQPLMNVAVLEEVPGSVLRRNFRDYAFWKPDLQTDENGKASFEATFPDDITGWNTFVLGMGSRRRTGQTSSFIQSYKPLIAQIAQPHFLIEGDQTKAIGKITNYKNEKIQLNRTLRINDKEVLQGVVEMQNSKIDSIALEPSGTDSLSVEYTVVYNKYKDGELRKIPVYRKGTMEANGIFAALDRDTTFTVSFIDTKTPMKLYAHADLVDAMLDEIAYLKNYPYECNEQLASRLQALILERLIKKYKGEKSGGSRDIEKTIKKLVGNQNSDGSWSWWKSGEGQSWITLHVANALMHAEKEGFAAPYDKEKLITYVESRLFELSTIQKLTAFQFLLEQGQTLKVREVTDGVKKSKTTGIHEKLLAEKVLQLSGEKVNWDWLNSVRSETIKGNYYWGEEKNDLTGNAIQTTLLAYQILSKENSQSKTLTKIVNYFLEHRKKTWRNTYESARILETLLPSLLQQKKSSQKLELKLSGGLNKTVENFPFEATTTSGSITVAKTGSNPVYFTAWQETWNADPTPSSKEFVVFTSFDDNQQKLTSGKPIRLNIEVEVLRDAEYVMIEVPIPAGCSYQSKQQRYTNGEVHREYFNHKTNIFCKFLKKGIYNYSIELLPRYSGKFILNPAVVECMYFPTLYGREGMKEVVIKRE